MRRNTLIFFALEVIPASLIGSLAGWLMADITYDPTKDPGRMIHIFLITLLTVSITITCTLAYWRFRRTHKPGFRKALPYAVAAGNILTIVMLMILFALINGPVRIAEYWSYLVIFAPAAGAAAVFTLDLPERKKS